MTTDATTLDVGVDSSVDDGGTRDTMSPDCADPSLTALAGSAGVLIPPFAPGATHYQLALPVGAGTASLTASAACPLDATITIDGVTVPSGTPSVAFGLPPGFAPRRVNIVVTAPHGVSRTYSVVIVRSDTYVKASNTDHSDSFGFSLALSADGSTLAVGAYRESSAADGVGGNQSDNSAGYAGAVYVFTRAGTTWSEQAYIKASNTDAMDEFGYAVALSADGSTLVVAADRESSNATSVGGDQADNAANASGAAYVYTRVGTAWSQQAYLKASNTDAGDEFGCAVALSADGSTLTVGARGEDSAARGIGGDQTDNLGTDAGAAYVFVRSGTTWVQQAYVKASNTDTSDDFGCSLALSQDGATLAVGAAHEDSIATGIDGDQANNGAESAGAAYLFLRVGVTWSQQAYVKASNTGAGDGFGGVALSADGSTLAVGAWQEASSATAIDGDGTDNSAPGAGAVYVFTEVGGVWSQQAYLKSSNAGANDHFATVALSSDGSRLAIGAEGESSSAIGIGGDQGNNAVPNAGAVYAFTRTGVVWGQEAYIKASNPDPGDFFGFAVALSADGSTLVAGSPDEASTATGIGGDQSNNSAASAGAVYVYR